jgi:cytochrome c-type biogenesis protein CcmH/NrfG
VVLLFGLVAGLLVALKAQGGRGSDAQDAEDALTVQKDLVLAQLRELDHHRERLGEEGYAQRREALVQEGALVLKELDHPKESTPRTGTRRAGGLWLGLGAAVAFVALAFLLVRTSTTPRQDDAPEPGSQAAVEALIATAMSTLETDPTHLDSLNVLCHYAILMGDMQSGMQQFMASQAVSPDHPEVVAHGSALAVLVGMTDRGIAGLETLLLDHPDHPEGLWWLAIAHLRQGEEETAKTLAHRILETAPGTEMAALAMDLLSQGPAPESTPQVSGQVLLEEGLESPEGGVFYIAALRDAAGSPPPVAAQRSEAWSMPADFSLGDADLTMGGEWPQEVWLRARIDADGNPSTTSEEDLVSDLVGPVAPGESVILTLFALDQ